MDYIEFDLDSAVSTQSSIPDYSSLDAPLFTMGRQIQNVVGFKIIETTIPTSYYTVTDEINKEIGYPRNRVGIEITGPFYPVVDNFLLTPNKNYTASELAVEIQSKIATLTYFGLPTTITSTCTYSTSTGKFIITMTPSPYQTGMEISFFFDPSIAQLLGYQLPNSTSQSVVLVSETSSTTFTFVSSYVALASGPNYMHINSKFFSTIVKNYLPQGPLGTVGQTNEAICQVPVLTNFGGVSCWQTAQPDSFNTQNLFQLEKFDLYLTLGTSKIPLKLNGLSWQCKIRVFIETNTISRSMAGNVDQSRVVRMIGQT